MAAELVVVHKEVFELLFERLAQVVDMPDVGVAMRATLDADNTVIAFAVLFSLCSPTVIWFLAALAVLFELAR